jgi:DNA-binding NarL/FixJ family response regulator
MEATTITDACADRTAAIDIVLVSPHPIYREALRIVLEREPGFTVVGNASNADEALDAITDLSPHVVIVNLSGPALERMLQMLKHLSAGCSRTRTIVATTPTEESDVVREDPRVAGIVSHQLPSRVMVDTVRRVAAGSCWLGRGPLDHLVEGMRKRRPTRTGRPGLTGREVAVIEAIGRALQPSTN